MIKEEIIGMCRACKEMTSLDESCCGAPIWFEGGWEFPEEEEVLDTTLGFPRSK